MAKIGWEPTQDELTQDEGEYFSMGEGKGESKQRCSNTPQDPWRGRRILINAGPGTLSEHERAS